MFDQNVLSPNHQRIYEWIKDSLELPIYAEVFRGALAIKHQKLPGHMMFLAHAGREIINGLARTYIGDSSKLVQYKNEFDKISLLWDEKWGASMGLSESEEPEYHIIPHDICKMIKSLVDKHEEAKDRSEETNVVFFSEFLDYEYSGDIPENFLAQWRDAKKWFVKYAHVNIRIGSPEQEAIVTRHFDVLVTFLSIAANSRQHKRLVDINEILQQANR